MSIQSSAIEYRPGTPERNCSLCYQSEQHLARGLVCLMWDEPTTREDWCGVGILVEKKPDVAEPGQIDLFS
jgi:hypothetical protein